jgi:ABC-type nitrate/sulfonate/bicarbonate transport system substrate-binding protein
MDELRISATAYGLNYLPQYFADQSGLFAAANLRVLNTARDPWTGVLEDLDSGAADVALGGLWVPAMFCGTPRRLTVFAQLNHQFPMAVVTRTPVEPFEWSWMVDRIVLAPGAGGSAPYAFTAGLMREAGVDPRSTRFVRDLSTAMLVELYSAGFADAIIADLTTATLLQERGLGHIAVEHTKVGGIMPNSVYYGRTDRVEELRSRLIAFTAAIERSMQTIADTSVAGLSGLMQQHWPAVATATLESVCARIKASRTWASVRVDAAASDRWMRILHEESMLESPPVYSQLIDNSVVDAISRGVSQ